MRFISLLLLSLIKLYKILISPFLSPSCRFLPSCSSYMAEAIKLHGPIKGVILGTKRIIRCNPFGGSGFDPVIPPCKNHKN